MPSGTNSADITATKTSGKSGGAKTSGKSGSAETEALGVDEGEVSGSENEAAFDYKTVSGQLEEIEKSIRKKQFTRQSLDDAAAFLTQQEIVIEFAAKGIEKNSKYVQDALNALGPEPAEGENEDPAIAEMRSKYTAVMNNYKNRLIEANLLKTEMARRIRLFRSAEPDYHRQSGGGAECLDCAAQSLYGHRRRSGVFLGNCNLAGRVVPGAFGGRTRERLPRRVVRAADFGPGIVVRAVPAAVYH